MRRLLIFITTLLLILPLVPAAAQPPAPDDGRSSDRPTSLDRDRDPEWRGEARSDVLPPSLRDADGTVEVIVELTEEPLAVTKAQGGQGATQTQQQAQVQSQQDGVVTRAKARDASTDEIARVQLALNAVVLEVPATQLGALADDPDVARISPVTDFELDLSEGVPFMGGDVAHDAGATGEGIRIAIIDTGVDYTHLALGGVDATECDDSGYTEDYLEAYGGVEDCEPDPTATNNRFPNEHFPNDKVVDGWDFVGEFWDGTADSPPLNPNANPIDFAGHGTHVAHIAAGQGDGVDIPDGMAPDADIIAIKVCSSVTPSCSGVAMLQAMDFALSPSGDPEMSDRVDVINMSIGALYGQADQNPISAAVENATAVGVLTVASAGNSADNPYITGTPAATPSALSVAAGAHPDDVIDVMQVVDATGTVIEDGEFPAVHQGWSAEVTETVEGEIFYDDSTPERATGCRDATGDGDLSLPNPFDAVDVEGKVVLVDRGICTFSEKIANIALAGGAVGVIAQNTEDPPFGGAEGDCPEDACHDIPGFMIFLDDGATIKANLGDEPLFGLFDPGAGLPVDGTMAGFSSRGPSMDGNLLKPEITGVGILTAASVGSGDDHVVLGGTSMSSPAVAGAAAAVLDGTSDGDDLRGPHEIKSVLMNTADRGAELSDLEASMPGVAGGFAPLTRAGTGNVDAGLANTSPAAMWDAANPTHGAALSFGFVDAHEPEVTLTREVLVRNYSDGDITYDVASELRYPTQATAGALDVDHPETVLVPAESTTTFDVTLTIDTTQLDPWFMDSGFEGGNGPLFSTYELDGFVVLSEQGGDSELTAAFHVLPRQSGDTSADTDTLEFAGLDPASVGLTNAGVGPSFINTYDLLGTSDEQAPAEPGAGAPVVDLHAAGIFQAAVGGDCGVYMELAVNTWHRTTHANFPASYEFHLDVDGDGAPDFIIFNFWGDPLGLTANNLTWAYDVAADVAFPLTFVEHPTNTANTVMWVCSDWVGVDADVGDEIGVDVLAADVYFTGQYTDIIEDAAIALGVNAFEAVGDFNLGGDSTGGMTFSQTPGQAADGVMMVLTSIRPAFGFAYSGAPEDAEAILLEAELEDKTDRLWGDNRVETAVDVSQDLYAAGSAGAVVLTRADDFADALAGAPLAAAVDAPLLLTGTASLHSTSAGELQRVLPEGQTVYVLGGPEAISDGVVAEVEALGYEVERVWGLNRFETAIAIAGELGDPNTLLVTTGANFPDALAAGAAAIELDGAVILSNGDQPHTATDAYLAANTGADVYAIGGPSATAYPDATAVFGATRLHTAVEVAEEFFTEPFVVGVSRDDDFPDALAGSAHVGRLGGPMLLTDTTTLSGVTGDYLCDNQESIMHAYVYGGTSAVAAATLDSVDQRIRGGGC